MPTAGPASPRWAIIILTVGALAGALVILAFENNRESLESWLYSDLNGMAERELLLLTILGALVVLPPLGFAVYFWRLAATMEAERARIAKILAIGLVIGAAGLMIVLGRLAVALAPDFRQPMFPM
jgi:hypothetical protein